MIVTLLFEFPAKKRELLPARGNLDDGIIWKLRGLCGIVTSELPFECRPEKKSKKKTTVDVTDEKDARRSVQHVRRRIKTSATHLCSSVFKNGAAGGSVDYKAAKNHLAPAATRL